MASGIIRLRPFFAAEANISIGTDGTVVAGKNMSELMKAALLLQRLREYDSSATTAGMVMGLATASGGRLLRQNVGRLQVGAKADFVMVDANARTTCPQLAP